MKLIRKEVHVREVWKGNIGLRFKRVRYRFLGITVWTNSFWI